MKTLCFGNVGRGVSHGYGAIVCWQCRHVRHGVSEGYEGCACNISMGSMRAVKTVSAMKVGWLVRAMKDEGTHPCWQVDQPLL